MPWLTRDKQKVGHVCDVPYLFHSTVRLDKECTWQCPTCLQLYKPYPYGMTKFKEHIIGPGDYWYITELKRHG